jgi:hypothetical protein
MCLMIEIVAPAISDERAGSVSRAVVDRGGVPLKAQRAKKGQQGSRFFLGDDCACALLGDNADWNAPFYDLNPKAMGPLEETLGMLLTATGGAGFTLRAAWVEGAWQPKTPARTRRVAFADLLSDLRVNRIENNVEYVVTQTTSLVPIPGLGQTDAAVVQGLLRSAGFFFHVHDGFGESPDVILIRIEDLPAIKKFLGNYRVSGARDAKGPISW